MIDSWITDSVPSTRFPYYTRANADEVGPEPFSPLGWSLGWVMGCIPGVADGFVDFGVVRRDELRAVDPEVFGNWGGYFYNQLSLPRTMGARMPGASPEAIDQAYFGDRPGVPAYSPHPDDNDQVQAGLLGEKMAWVMSTDGFPAMDSGAVRARQVRASRPDLASLSDADLVAYARSMAPIIWDVWRPYCETCLACSLGPGAVQAICAGLGRGEDAVKLLASVGNIETADASLRMWELSRTVRNSPALMAAFDAGVAGLRDRLDAIGDAPGASFHAGFIALLADFGHRGPNEWDMRPHSWETDPSLPLGMIERLRHQDDARSPFVAAAKAAEERERLAAEFDRATAGDPTTQATLAAGLRSAGIFFALRERGKNALIRVIHEGKVAFMELGRRMAAAAVIDDPQQIFMLLETELDPFLADPMSFRSTLLDRGAAFAALGELEPPYIVKQEDGVPPISTWAKRGSTASTVLAAAGEVLQGTPGAPGIVTGRARIVLDPSSADDLEPDDIMVVVTTDPSWTPLFLSVGGVVCNVGAVASHAAIVCRELGVPCAVSVVDATSRIPEGATIAVDGSTGTVTVLSA